MLLFWSLKIKKKQKQKNKGKKKSCSSYCSFHQPIVPKTLFELKFSASLDPGEKSVQRKAKNWIVHGHDLRTDLETMVGVLWKMMFSS